MQAQYWEPFVIVRKIGITPEDNLPRYVEGFEEDIGHS